VIDIIGILATVSVISLSNARAKSRDAKRVGDMKQIQTALELFFNDKGRYPNFDEWNTGSIFSTSTGATSTYMQVIPTAPTPNDGLCTVNQNSISYVPTSDGSSYSISLCLGGNTGALTSGPKCLTPAGIIDANCSCGDPITITSVANHTCTEGAPDYDQCTYDTVKIGSQCWMKQNMNVGNIVNGNVTQENNSIMEKYCYDPDGALSDYTYCQTDGGLYQWNEAMQYSVSEGTQGICPTGWHVPSDSEQNSLDQYLTDIGQTCDANRGAYDCATAGTKLKVGGTSGFNSILAGYCGGDGSFYYQGVYAFFWSSSISGFNAWLRYLVSN